MGEQVDGGDGCKVKSDIVGEVTAGTGQREKDIFNTFDGSVSPSCVFE